MSLAPVEFDPAAIEEARQAYVWYSQRSRAAADRFMRELDAAVAAIQAAPERFGPYLFECRRRKLKRYPYLVVYRASLDCILVVAIAHVRRRPGYWKERLQ